MNYHGKIAKKLIFQRTAFQKKNFLVTDQIWSISKKQNDLRDVPHVQKGEIFSFVSTWDPLYIALRTVHYGP